VGVAFSTTALWKTGIARTLFVTVCELRVAACPPAEVCSGLEDGFVYATVTTSPLTTALDRVSLTLPDTIATDETVLVVELTLTVNAEAAGTILASEGL
jgi:hypothetical protein